MPLFKVTEKRMAKRQREDELGITELKAKMREMGEASGSGSGSGSDSGSDEGDESEEDEEEEDDGLDDESVGTMDDEEDTSDEEDPADEEEGDAAVEEAKDESEEESGSEDGFDMSIEEVGEHPIYPVHPPGTSACVLCPGRMFKNSHMEKEHLASQPHLRSSKRWKSRIAEVENGNPLTSDDPRDIVDEINASIGAKSAPVKGETRQNGAAPVSEATPPSTQPKKRKRTAQERQEAKARKLVEEAQAAGKSGKKSKVDKAEGAVEVKLNRKARRIAEGKTAKGKPVKA